MEIYKKNNEYIMLHNNKNIGSCSFCFPLTEPDVIFISRLGVDQQYRNKKIATKLLLSVFIDYYNKGFRFVELVDASSRYRQKKNIYKILGLYYKYYDNDMRGNLRHILYGKKLIKSPIIT